MRLSTALAVRRGQCIASHARLPRGAHHDPARSGLHVVLPLLLVKLTLLLRGGVLDCWDSETRSFMLLSASVNSISSMPSPVYQWRKAFRRNIPVKYSATRLNISWIAVEFPAKDTAIFSPFGGMSQIPLLMLFGIHSTK